MRFKKISAVLLAGVLTGALMLGGCSKIDNDAVVVTMELDDENSLEITLGYANFAAHLQQAAYDSILGSYYGEGYWISDDYATDGVTMEESMKDSVLEDLEIQSLLVEHMEDYNVTVTDEEQEAISEAAAQFMEDNGKDAIKATGATQEYAENYLYLQTVKQKMQEAIRATADTEVSDEEAAQRTFSYVQISLTTYTDEDGNSQTYTDEEVETVKAQAQEAAAMAQTDFDGMAEQYSYDVSTYSYGSDEESEEDGGFNDAVIEAANGMTAGAVSGLIEGTDCYYIIRLDSEFDEEATAQKKESIISDRQDAVYEEVTNGYLEDVEITVDKKQWAKVKFEDLFTAASESSTDTE